MNTRKLVLSVVVAIVAIAACTLGIQAQGPMYDKVIVNLPYSVTVANRTLQPGEYTIQQLPAEGGARRVLLIYSGDGMKFETSAMTIPALDNRTPQGTKVILHHYGNDYYFDKIWIQGKNYGYEFPVPESVKSRQRERMEPMNVAARYESTTAEGTTSRESVSTTTSTTQPNTPKRRAAPEPQEPAAAPAPSEARVPPAPAPEPSTSSADRMAQENTVATTMPSTAANWLLLLLSGGALSGVALALRRS